MKVEECEGCMYCRLAKWGRMGNRNVYYCEAMGKRIEEVKECPYG